MAFGWMMMIRCTTLGKRYLDVCNIGCDGYKIGDVEV